MKPNIVIILVDALRADRVGVLGRMNLTPEIDEFAEDATIFSNAFSTSNATDVAVSSIQTGRYPLANGIINHGFRVTEAEKAAIEEVPQLPEVLSDVGYRTAKFGRPLGRWHRKGFDRYPSSEPGSEAFDERSRDFRSDLEANVGATLSDIHPAAYSYVKKLYDATLGRHDSQAKVSARRKDHDEIVEEFTKFVDEGSPFFAFLHLMDTHSPYHADPLLVKENLETYDYDVLRGNDLTRAIPKSFMKRIEQGHFQKINDRYCFPDGEPSTAIIGAHYDAAVREADVLFGRLISILEDRSVLNDSIVVFLSDHGESLTEHGIYYDHGHGLYDTIVRVPLIIRTPESQSARIEQLVQITDIAPTITSYAKVAGLSPDGFSLLPAMEDEQIGREVVMAEHTWTSRRRMIRTTHEKMIYLLSGSTICRNCGIQHAPAEELYDLKVDPSEKFNRAMERPKRFNKLRGLAEATASEYSSMCPEGRAAVEYEDENEVFERLKALGYR